MSRLPVFFAGPILLVAASKQRARLAAWAATALALWLVVPISDEATEAAQALDSSTEEYYAPLIDFVEHAPGPAGRVEIPFTRQHWEATWVASHVPLARGWERQADINTNSLFYTEQLDASAYHDWLLAHAVRWVALPDAPLDYSAVSEAKLLEDGQPWLEPIFHDAHWRVWEVGDARPIVDAPGRLVRHDATGMTVDVDRPGRVVIREQFSPYWTILVGDGACLTTNREAQLVLVVERPGRFVLTPSLGLGPALTGVAVNACTP